MEVHQSVNFIERNCPSKSDRLIWCIPEWTENFKIVNEMVAVGDDDDGFQSGFMSLM